MLLRVRRQRLEVEKLVDAQIAVVGPDQGFPPAVRLVKRGGGVNWAAWGRGGRLGLKPQARKVQPPPEAGGAAGCASSGMCPEARLRRRRYSSSLGFQPQAVRSRPKISAIRSPARPSP